MEDLGNRENIVEKEIINITPEVEPVTPDSIQSEISEVNLGIGKQDEVITMTTMEVSNVRHETGLVGEVYDIPSISTNIKKKSELESRKIELENKLQELLKSDVSAQYTDVIGEIKKSKIDWAQSEELSRRLKLKGATDEDVLQVKNWLVDNASNAKTFVLPPDKFKEVVSVLHEMTGEENIKEGSAFYVPGGRTDVPEYIKSSVVVREKLPLPPLPGQEMKSASRINVNELHHEFGHATQDGLLDSELYKDWKPTFKDSAPDKEYIGLIRETDTRITSVYRDLGDTFDPQKEVFGKKHLEILKDKLAKGQLDNDTKDLFEHYDDITIMKMANRMPSI